jgi:UDP-glucose 4-epimerase
MHYLVTGGAGYIGSVLCNRLIKAGHKISIFDNLSTGHKKLIHPEARFIQGDLTKSEDLTQAFANQEHEAVIHLAALSCVSESHEKAELYHEMNVIGTKNLLQAMQSHGVTNLIFSSTAAVYGDQHDQAISEDAELKPINPYGKTKKEAEDLIKAAQEEWGLRSVIFRYFNAAGAAEDGQFGELHDPETHLIPCLLQAAQNDESFHLYGTNHDTPDGTAIRDFIHVEDIADAHLLALAFLEKNKKSEIFNIGSDKGYSVREVLELNKKVIQKNIDTKEQDIRAGDPAFLIANSNKIREQLGWSPKRNLEQMISDSWAWIQQQANV